MQNPRAVRHPVVVVMAVALREVLVMPSSVVMPRRLPLPQQPKQLLLPPRQLWLRQLWPRKWKQSPRLRCLPAALAAVAQRRFNSFTFNG